MGRHAVRALARLGTADRILIADLDIDRAQRLADEVGPTATATELDATDPGSYAPRVHRLQHRTQHDGSVSHVLVPRYCARPSTQSATTPTSTTTGNPRSKPSNSMTRARSSGRRVIIGLGASPGTTNVCARLAAERLDEVDDLYTGWSLASAVVESEDHFPAQGAAAAGNPLAPAMHRHHPSLERRSTSRYSTPGTHRLRISRDRTHLRIHNGPPRSRHPPTRYPWPTSFDQPPMRTHRTL